MRVWADVYDTSGNRLGKGPITSIQSATVSRVLDGAGTISLMYPATDERALALIQNECRVRLFVEIDGTIRELGRGIIRDIGLAVQEGGLTVTAIGPDSLDALTRPNTLLGRKYENQYLETIVDDLIGLVDDWSATVDSGLAQHTARFDGANILSALLTLVEEQDLHLREGTTANTLEVGVFGETVTDAYGDTVRVVGPLQAAQREAHLRDNLIYIESLSQNTQSESIVNWVIPLGAGEGEAALTLEKSTRTEPYSIQSMTGPDGRTLYYLTDAASVATYGEIQRVSVWEDIAPISTSAVDQQRAANALYDAAAAWLRKNAVILETYSFTCRKPRVTIRPGDKIQIRYKGVVEKPDGLLTYADINDSFWVTSASETATADGLRLQLEVSTIDRQAQSVEQVIVAALESITVSSTAIQSYYTKNGYVYRREMDSSHTAAVPIYISDATQALDRCLIRIKTRPFRATSQGAAAGGSHRHKMFDNNGASGYAPSTGDWVDFYAKSDVDGTDNVNVMIPVTSTPITDHLCTFDAADDHTHPAAYGISDDTEYPDTVRIRINGTDRTSDLGGPWGAGGVEISEELDITEYINAAANLQQEHTVTFSCDDGQGEIEAVIDLYEIIQTIRATS